MPTSSAVLSEGLGMPVLARPTNVSSAHRPCGTTAAVATAASSATTARCPAAGEQWDERRSVAASPRPTPRAAPGPRHRDFAEAVRVGISSRPSGPRQGRRDLAKAGPERGRGRRLSRPLARARRYREIFLRSWVFCLSWPPVWFGISPVMKLKLVDGSSLFWWAEL